MTPARRQPPGPSASPARRSLTRLPGVALALLTVAVPLPWAPAWTYPLAAAGAAAALLRWREPPVLAVIITSAFSDAGPPVLAAEGLLILAYLLLADAPPALAHPARWLRHQLPLLAAGLVAAAAAAAALAVHQASSLWITLAGIAAAVAAYLLALPSLRKR
jgi:hypothetical protein